MKTDIAKVDNSPARLMEVALNQNADVDKLEKLMLMQERWDANQAKKSYFDAITNFQKKSPIIKKVKQGHNYKYAPLSDIVAQIKNALHECGLSFRFEQNHNDGIEIACVVTHIDGHSERTMMKADPDTSGSKNIIQAAGSTVTYLQRYTLIGALGISTADEDMDGRIGNEVDHIAYMDCVRDNFDEITDIKTAHANEDYGTVWSSWREMPREVQERLWLAPSKGGVFTSAEREAIKTKKQ